MSGVRLKSPNVEQIIVTEAEDESEFYRGRETELAEAQLLWSLGKLGYNSTWAGNNYYPPQHLLYVRRN